MLQQGDTISAIATPPGEGGIGIIRISGEHALSVADTVFRAVSGKKIADYETQRAVFGHVVDREGQIVDEAMALIMKAPHSYTKEDVVELQCHGGMMPLRKTLALTYQAGARAAERGEFTKRAFLNGRLDLSQAQAVMDVISAKTETSLKMANGHLQGKFSQAIHAMRERIMAMIAHLEAEIDFPEDGVEEVVIDDVKKSVVDLRNEIGKLLKTAHTGKILRDGLTTAIVGKPNVGKSSLLNALLQEDRAIVTDIPGTTRDSIEEYANVGGIPLRIIDTAGIRETDDVVEKIGVDKSRSYIEDSSLVLALFDGSRPLDAEDKDILELLQGRDVILLVTKDDLTSVTTAASLQQYLDAPVIAISTVTGEGLDKLAEEIQQKVYAGGVSGDEGGFVNDERQVEILRQADEHLAAALKTIEADLGLDFISIDLRSAWEKLGEITGETVGEQLIDEIFSRFCIGK